MEIKQNLVNPNKYNIKCPYYMVPEFFIVHNTANDASAQNEINYMINNNNEVSFHLAIDDIEVVQGIPTNRNTWNAGDGANGKGNRCGISIEICYSKSGGEKFIQAEKNAAQYIASELKARGWGIDKVKKHQDFNGKYCPHRTLDMGWDRFLNMIKTYMGETPETQTSYTVKVTVPALNIRAGAGTAYQIVGCIKDQGVYTIVETQNNWGKLKSGAGWICLDYTSKNVAATKRKSNEEIAKEIVYKPNYGGWGTGAERKRKLEAAGYNYKQVQDIVNRLV